MTDRSRWITKLVPAAALCLLTLLSAAPAEEATGRTPVLPETPYNYASVTLPPHLAVIRDNIPADNPITDHGATLGRVLFYDRRLSANDTTACASCHLQEYAFSDPERFSTGFSGGKTPRNAMGLANGRFFQADQFFWDARVESLEELILLPIQNPIEMGNTLERAVAKVAAAPFYPPLFAKAFGSPEVTQDRIAKAMAQFLRAMVSYQSRYDEGVATGFRNFTGQEKFGMELFNAQANRCARCHLSDTQILLFPRNNGLDLVYSDKGMGSVTGDGFDNGRFKPPSLRNVGLTGPYMHDGRFATLQDVLEHYSSGIQSHNNLGSFLPDRGLDLTARQRNAMEAFLHTLTDLAFTSDPKFSDPFARPRK
ncbi:MAG: cytochrome-c peroxidase [Candidatus Tectomicrobia bacterium]|nr:cytochrome-c peroxidase [Candidatus Tectomicrobia bacterium]